MSGKESVPELQISQTITKHLQRSRFSGKYADFKIIVGSKVFPTHRFILGNKSAYFRDLLHTNADKNTPESCDHSEYSADAIGVCLEYIYTDRLEFESHNAPAVLRVAHHWTLRYVVTKCEQLLKTSITSSNCIKTRALATKLGLAELGECANKVILSNFEMVTKAKDLIILSVDDMKSIKETAMERASVRIKDLWTLFYAWYKRKSKTGPHCLCECLHIFPFNQFTVTGFKEQIWENEHVSHCEKCQEIAARVFLGKFDEPRKDDDVLFLKKLAKKYDFRTLNEITRRHIVANHLFIFTNQDMDELDNDDLMECINDIEDMCTPGEFTAIVKWMGKSETRQDIFPQIFKCVEDPTCAPRNVFLSSICGFFGLSEPTAAEAASSTSSEQYWWPKYCLFLKKLARKYDCSVTEKFVDQCIAGGFMEICQDVGFLELSASDLITYLSSKSTYSCRESEIWEAIMCWIRHHESRKESFQPIFDSLKLEEFTTAFLRSHVLINALVMDSKTSAFSVMREVLRRLEILEVEHAEMKKNLRNKNNRKHKN